MEMKSVMFPGMKNQAPSSQKRRRLFTPPPHPVSNGPWDPNSMNVACGRSPRPCDEDRHGSDEFVPARMTVDMFRRTDILTPGKSPQKKLIREGKRSGGKRVFLRGTRWRALHASVARTEQNAPGMSGRRRMGRAVARKRSGARRPPGFSMNGKLDDKPITGHRGSLERGGCGERSARNWSRAVADAPLSIAQRVRFCQPVCNAG